MGFSDPPTSGVVQWLIVPRGQAIAVPIELTLPGATTATLASFNAFVRHPQPAAITGPFHFALYASNATGFPVGQPLGAVDVATFPYSPLVSAGANITLQSFATPGVTLTPGARYWIALAVESTASANLNIITNTTGTSFLSSPPLL